MTTDPDSETGSADDAPRRGALPLNRRAYLQAGTAASLSLLGGNVVAADSKTAPDSDRSVTPEGLRVDYQQAPNNLDPTADPPQFFWELPTTERDVTQTAYRVLVADSATALQNETGTVWDSGEVASDESTGVEYGGPSLSPDTTYHWAVRVWNEDGNGGDWRTSAFTTAIPGADEHWGGDWIGAGRELTHNPLLRRVVDIEKDVESARLHLSGLGFYELYVNEERVGDRVLDPGRTHYLEHVFYSTYDVTDLLATGKNAIGVALGRGRTGENHARVDLSWYSDPELLFQLNITYTDGSSTMVVSDEDWLVAEGATNDISLLEGKEFHDARREKPGWAAAEYDDSDWDSVSLVDGPRGEPVPQRVQPMKITDTVEPVEMWEPEDGVFVYDLGQMIAGWPELTVDGPSGATVDLTLAEQLEDDNTVEEISWSDLEHGRYKYTLDGDGGETWTPRFTYTGFRYVQVEGYPGEPDPDSVAGKVLHTVIDEGVESDFTSSNQLFNQIHENTRWAYLNNMHSIPTDTPVWEKLGWTADALTTAETGMYNFDMPRFWRKWLRDIRDSQLDNGDVPHVAPNEGLVFGGWGGKNDPGWDAAYPMVAWWAYQYYGDERFLEEHYDGLKEYVRFVRDNSEDGRIVRTGLGDWMTPNGDNLVPIVNTAYYHRSAAIVAEAAETLGHDADKDAFSQLRDEIRTAFNDAFFDASRSTYQLESDRPYRQTANVLPLAFGLVPDGHEQAVADNLATNVVEEHDGHLDTGLHGVTYLLDVLSEYGHHDVAYTVANQTTHPSWGYWIKQGMTSLLEEWNLEARSRNHHFLGAIDEWFYQYLAGIREPAEPGFEHVEIAPLPVGDLDQAEATTETVRGSITASWRRVETPGTSRTRDGLVLEAVVPGNTTATVRIPTLDGEKVRVRENGKTIWNNGSATRPNHSGVQRIDRDGDAVVAEVGSGEYRFELEHLGNAS